MNERRIASVSFGKDSLSMLLLILERGLPLDEVVFYDTGMEFKAIYDTRDKVLPLLADHGVRYTELRPPRPFVFDMLDKPVNSKKNGLHYGYSWCGGCARWGTACKTHALGTSGSPPTNRSALKGWLPGKSHPWRSSASRKRTPWRIATNAASSGRKTAFVCTTFLTACRVGVARTRT